MNADPGEFDTLRNLLALKRHEQPPPGYFNTLSGKICARIERDEQAPDVSLLGRLFTDRIKPALGYSFVFSVCGMMAYAANSFFHLEAQPALARESSTPNQTLAMEPGEEHPVGALTSGSSFQPSRTPSLSPSLFFQPQVQPASFQLNGN